MSQPSVIGEVVTERQRQDARWGGAYWDDSHSTNDWLAIMVRHLGLAGNDGDTMIPSGADMVRYRRQMIRVAALAVAAVESIDRLRGKPTDAL
jgi:hypothetical protein